MSSVLPSAEKCGRCVNFIPRNWSCLEWHIQVQPEAKACNRFQVCDGLADDDFKPVMTVQISKSEESELGTAEQGALGVVAEQTATEKASPKKRVKLGEDKAVELILAGCSQYEIARQFGVSKATVASHVANAVKKGRLVKVGYGKYAAPQQEEDEKLAVHDEQAVQGGAGQEAESVVGVGEPEKEPAGLAEDKLSLLEKQLTEFQEGVVERLVAVGVFITELKNSVKRIEEQLDELWDVAADLRDEVQAPARIGQASRADRLLGIVEAQLRILEAGLGEELAAQEPGEQFGDDVDGREVA
jgi:predicted transcriptional regulator